MHTERWDHGYIISQSFGNSKSYYFECYSTLQIYTMENGTPVKSVKVTSICHTYYNVEV